MILRRMYYIFKPLLPRSAQIALRRWLVLSRMKRHEHVWPIDEEAGRRPENWKGWPNGKQFAFVLTHDIESEKGQKRCFEIAELEKNMGLRSCFNFVAEGYKIDQGLFAALKADRFEIGLHGLTHDWRLYKSRKEFESQAVDINKYLKNWDLVGFRSPCMFHNLEWIKALNIEYDMSTFDTDPFEPQPDGVRTIFPFIVYRNAVGLSTSSCFSSELSALNPQLSSAQQPIKGSNAADRHHDTHFEDFYVELPYTLPQDHLLFVILKQPDIQVWKQKLDWIAEKGGLALLNTHPDYMKFDGTELCLEEYPRKYYAEFLEFVCENYGSDMWHALPREVARFCREQALA